MQKRGPPAQARGAQPQIEPAACAMQLWIYLGCTPAMSEGVMLCSVSVWIEKGSHQANLLHLQHPPAALLLPAGYLLSLATLGGPHPPLLSSLTVSPELLTCIWRAGWRGGGGRRSGARREVFWCMVHHTCFNHSVSQTAPRRGLLQHITEYTQLVI